MYYNEHYFQILAAITCFDCPHFFLYLYSRIRDEPIFSKHKEYMCRFFTSLLIKYLKDTQFTFDKGNVSYLYFVYRRTRFILFHRFFFRILEYNKINQSLVHLIPLNFLQLLFTTTLRWSILSLQMYQRNYKSYLWKYV